MSVVNKIGFFQNRRDEVPNQELARELAETNNKKGIREIAENLWNDNENVRGDCVKVLYEIGYLNPELIADYADDFLRLLHDRNNRLVWGGMIALSTIAHLRAKDIYKHQRMIKGAMDKGSVITKDGGVRTLATVASADDAYQAEIFPYLLNHLATCRPKDVAQHSEKTLVAVNADNKRAFIQVLEERMSDLTDTQATRVRRVLKAAEAR